MTVSWRESLFLGTLSFLFTYLFSSINNTWQMSIFRAGIGFLLFFFLGFILKLFFRQIVHKKNTSLPTEQVNVETSDQNELQNSNDVNQKDDPLFQEITLGSLHTEDNNR